MASNGRKPIAKTGEPGRGRPKVGRPTKLDAGVQERIMDAIRKGATIEMAAQYGGISGATFYNWQQRGREGERPFVEFFEALKAAEAEGVVTCLTHITTAAQSGAWQAAAWILERRYPATYGRQQRIEAVHDIHDWRKEAIAAGLDPDAMLDAARKALADAMADADRTNGAS